MGIKTLFITALSFLQPTESKRLFAKVLNLAPYEDIVQKKSAERTNSNTTAVQLLTEQKKNPAHPHSVTTDNTQPAPEWVNNPLAEYFFKYDTGYKIWKWHHYFRVYDRHLSPFLKYKGERINMLAIGVQSGGEIGMWQSYFGENFYFYGVDINPACKELEQSFARTQIFIGDQGDPALVDSVRQSVIDQGGVIHIILDDGSHINWHQIFTFERLYPYLHGYGGVYVVEDAANSYMPPTDVHRQPSDMLAGVPAIGAMGTGETLVEHMKNRVDYVNGYWANPAAGGGDAFVTSVDSIHFYDGMAVVEKYPHPHPVHESRGSVDIPYCTAGQANGCLTL